MRRLSVAVAATAVLASSVTVKAERLPSGVIKLVHRAGQSATAAARVGDPVATDLVDCAGVGNACVLGGPLDENLLIPDNGQVSASFPVTRGTLEGFFGTTNCTIARAQPAVELSHGDVGDLQVRFRKGTTSVLLADFAPSCNATRLDAIFSDFGGAPANTCGVIGGAVQRSAQALSVFNGTSALDTYGVDVADTATSKTGTFERWGYALDVNCSPLAPPVSCSTSSTALCLQGHRFRVTTEFLTNTGASGAGSAFPMTSDTGAFTFFDPANVEVVVKVLNGCGVNGRYWVFMAGLTNVRVYVTVIDVDGGGNSNTYTNPLNTDFAPTFDTNAFVCP